MTQKNSFTGSSGSYVANITRSNHIVPSSAFVTALPTSSSNKNSIIISIEIYLTHKFVGINNDKILLCISDAPCLCKDLLLSGGAGNCTTTSKVLGGKVWCYVSQPSGCEDARNSTIIAGEKYSAFACLLRGNNNIISIL